MGGLRGGGGHILMGISLLTPTLQTCQASNVSDCKFPGVCALFTAPVVPPSAELSALLLTSGIRSSGGSQPGTITPIDHGILKVSVTLTPPAHLLFPFKSLFVPGGKSIERALVKQRHAPQSHCRDSNTWEPDSGAPAPGRDAAAQSTPPVFHLLSHFYYVLKR